ncbi:uncharacterized protein LOC106174526 [Lingula anatina]|uniref:Uncharacterized protein LOC106174526 n=1 Tax=Lingula anatina TaxID=7574 RepID=A0A1S3JME6_LINAN|nr:uncharacterized protein LOC106174526 [Lingula anatina]|eukprot:XP_013411580.1 uncharacterized protein LOC106174526 [Lingula anatina]
MDEEEQIAADVKEPKENNILLMSTADDDTSSTRGCCVRKHPFDLKVFLKKYFWEGQHLLPAQEEALRSLSPDAKWYKKFMVKHRRIVAFAIPVSVIMFAWLSIMIRYNYWGLFTDKYFMTITMVLGSLVAGMTSEAGGAVAFPVMTLAFKISPIVARDFSMAIQSVGLPAAAFTIIYMQIHLEWHAILFSSLGGAAGIIIGLEYVSPLLTPPQKKLGFVCIWFTFAFALFFLNINHKRRTFLKIPTFNCWKALVLVLTGFAGGMFTSFAGSGLDICSFSILTLLFRVSEKTATPTSIVLMAGNTVVGLFWRAVIIGGVSIDCWEYVAVTVPVVIVGAPFGSVIGSHFHRLVLAALIYVLDTVALVAAFAIVRPLTTELILISVGIIIFGAVFFASITKIGTRILKNIEALEKRSNRGDGLEEANSEFATTRESLKTKSDGRNTGQFLKYSYHDKNFETDNQRGTNKENVVTEVNTLL